jgi:hypothetical protein
MPIPEFRPDGYLPEGLHPEEIFGVLSPERWEAWVQFFSQTREPDGRRKGLVELTL